MGLFDSVFTTFDNAVSGLFGSGSTSGSYLGDPYGSAPSSPVVYEYPQPQGYPQTMNVQMPAVVAAGGMMMARFPALWAALTALSQRFGTKITVDRLWGMFKTFGPGIGAMIGAEALQELMVYRSTHKRRRMNVANTKALRRSVRRLKGFDRLSHRVSAQLGRVGGRRGRARSRCLTCRKSPCSC